MVNLPSGDQIAVRYDFERPEKRCYTCQRLTHEQEQCPLFLKKESFGKGGKEKEKEELKEKKEPTLKEGDPLFGILTEEHVGLDPETGRPKIDKEVLEGMRIYILVGPEEERPKRESRVKSSLEEVRKDPLGQYSLSLDPVPIISTDLDKDKGRFFDYEGQDQVNKGERGGMKQNYQRRGFKISDRILERMSNEEEREELRDEERRYEITGFQNFSSGCSTDYRVWFSEPSSSGTIKKKRKARKRPHMSNRKPKTNAPLPSTLVDMKKKGKMVGSKDKRKIEEVIGPGENDQKKGKREGALTQDTLVEQAVESSKHEVLPVEGLSPI